ncbi:MAG: DUF86 domain-containing protein [Clostridia bacterium]|nr:DUF86 domain-containing protein [Clostridia bacterium]
MSESERDLSILEHVVRYCGQIDDTILRFGSDGQIFASDTVYQNAVALCLLQIGELAGHLSESYRAAHPDIPWRQIKALRNIIAHNYGSVDAETAWEIVQEDIPALRQHCEKEINRFSKA